MLNISRPFGQYCNSFGMDSGMLTWGFGQKLEGQAVSECPGIQILHMQSNHLLCF